MDGVFVTGTDTNVGKTAVCAGLLRMLHGSRDVAYWKPIQTGTMVGDDTNDVKTITKLGDDSVIEPSYRFPDPVSPHFAAKRWGKQIDLSTIMGTFQTAKKAGKTLVVEGAGGLLVPLNDKELLQDLIKLMKLPLIIVTVDRVGAINSTLLTVNACRAQNIPVLGVVVSRSRGNLGNAEGISEFGKVEVLAEIPPIEDAASLTASIAGHPRLRKLFGLPPLP